MLDNSIKSEDKNDSIKGGAAKSYQRLYLAIITMKKCSYCGREYGDDVMHCETDGEKLNRIAGSSRMPVAENPVGQGFVPVEENAATLNAQANREMVVGALWCGGGILITVLTYSAASGPQGGTYLLAWGPIIFGGIQFFRGLLSRT